MTRRRPVTRLLSKRSGTLIASRGLLVAAVLLLLTAADPSFKPASDLAETLLILAVGLVFGVGLTFPFSLVELHAEARGAERPGGLALVAGWFGTSAVVPLLMLELTYVGAILRGASVPVAVGRMESLAGDGRFWGATTPIALMVPLGLIAPLIWRCKVGPRSLQLVLMALTFPAGVGLAALYRVADWIDRRLWPAPPPLEGGHATSAGDASPACEAPPGGGGEG